MKLPGNPVMTMTEAFSQLEDAYRRKLNQETGKLQNKVHALETALADQGTKHNNTLEKYRKLIESQKRKINILALKLRAGKEK